jgi:hypothetical protein
MAEFRYYPGMCLEEMRKTTKKPVKIADFQARI